MDVQQAYNIWAAQYDTNENKTRDLEAVALRATLQNIKFNNCLEIGCGTGKNTEWLVTKAAEISSVDFSMEMLAKAKSKVASEKVKFIQADFSGNWFFAGNKKFDLITFSLVLEHIENLNTIFEKTHAVTEEKGYVYIGELHPFKQYEGSKARFETENGLQTVSCFNHHISELTGAANRNGFNIILLQEYFDENNKATLPRILTLLLKKIK